MAKDKSKTKETKPDPKEEKAAEREFKFGVEDIAEALDIKPASVRVQLRNKGIEKAGKSYGWNSKAELKEVIDALKAKAEKEEDDEPKSKGKKKAEPEKKADKKAKGKKKPADDDDD